MFVLVNSKQGYLIPSSDESHIKVFKTKDELIKYYGGDDAKEEHLPDWAGILEVELALVLPD